MSGVRAVQGEPAAPGPPLRPVLGLCEYALPADEVVLPKGLLCMGLLGLTAVLTGRRGGGAKLPCLAAAAAAEGVPVGVAQPGANLDALCGRAGPQLGALLRSGEPQRCERGWLSYSARTGAWRQHQQGQGNSRSGSSDCVQDHSHML
jgi:hypothetical protein